jgi:hypothetical protein
VIPRLKLTKRRGVIVIFLLVILTIGILDSRFLWTGWSPDTGGLCLASQRYGGNANMTYSIMFFGVNFTFLYWTYPSPLEGPNGTTIVVMDAPYRAFFKVTFTDGTSENLSLYVGGYVGIVPFQFPHGVRTAHSRPSAGVVTGEVWELWGGWQYTVAMLG